MVTHVLPDAFDFLSALRRCTNLLGVIPKPKSIHDETKRRLESSGIRVIETARENISLELTKLLGDDRDQDEELVPERNTVLLDIGGWFVPALQALPDKVLRKICGVVEDTKNGQDKYQKFAEKNKLPFPVVSLAESHLKANEDHLVGQSIVFSADAILRDCGLVLEHLECGIIGYGKIGKSITSHLLQRGVKPYVVENNPLRRLEAFREQCSLRGRDWVNRNVDVIFSATGNQATNIIDFRGLRPGAFLISVTSSDDEFDLTLLEGEFARKEVAKYVTRFDSGRGHFHLVNNGNAINFLHNAVLWEFIQLVKGGLFLATRNLAEGRAMERIALDLKGPGFENLVHISDEDQSEIAKLWMETVLLGISLEK